jgi:chromosome segregation ATPase
MLLQNGFIPISNESDRSIAQSIRDSFLAILPEYQRRGKELVKQFEDRKEWKTKIQKLQDKLLECHKTIAVYKKQVEEIQNDTRKNKEQDVLHQRDHQKEVLVLRREVENLKAKADGYESIAKRKEQEIMQLKQQLEKQVKSEEDKNKEAKNIFEQFHAK